MRWNDDIVNQKILGVEQTDESFKLCLSNGMEIILPKSVEVWDASVLYPMKRWVTYKDGERVRTPMPRPVQHDPGG